ncbi:hypothetical protein BC936DRAFT_146990 [Jimgerdemannia flammicorona]|uniref:Uncharacterized protein n=1 Tax=Jimgerdemannia flammicorona TaxID=994334 RepID=A0A433D6H0_9FUNG|nr:hypothetical protein BC936DRAFT_146990 [Jimgerdemannia flammicorona]
MGNCCGKKSSKSRGYMLSERPGSTSHKTSDDASRLLSAGGAGGKAEAPEDRDARLAAAEQRRQESEGRGVQKSGGKLSKQLAEQRAQRPGMVEEPAVDNLMSVCQAA